MEPYNGKDIALWKTVESSSSSGIDSDDDEESDDEKKVPKGYFFKKKVPIKKIFKVILVKEELIPE
jgi:hypothetical protein